jgi:kumamolisin
VLGCGGTHLLLDGAEGAESAWRERVAGIELSSGGGASAIFGMPHWQRTAGLQARLGKRGRGVPDVAGKADLLTGYVAHIGGMDVPLGGTSAAAPMWAGLMARIGQASGVRTGFIAPLLYQSAFRGATRDVTRGTAGGGLHAAAGWDPCTGWGSPLGTVLAARLAGVTSQGTTEPA